MASVGRSMTTNAIDSSRAATTAARLGAQALEQTGRRVVEVLDVLEHQHGGGRQGCPEQRHDQALEPWHQGVYVNFLGDEGADRIRQSYGPEKYERLRALKRKYDPDNLFRLNQNIPPD